MAFVKLINDEGEEIGCIDKAYLVPLGLRHQIVRVVVYCPSTQEVLMQQRSFTKDTCPGMWDTSASGHVDAHEETKMAALRELKEELGITAEPNQLVATGDIHTDEKLPSGRLVRDTTIYVLSVPSIDLDFRVDPSELETAAWLPIKSLLADDSEHELTKGARLAIQALVNSPAPVSN